MIFLTGALAGTAGLRLLLSNVDPGVGVLLAVALTGTVAWRGATAVTGRIAARRASQLQDRIGLLLHASADGIIGLDDRRTISVFNAGAERMFGFTAAEVIGRDLGVLLPESCRATHGAHVDRFATGTTWATGRNCWDGAGTARTFQWKSRSHAPGPAIIS